MSSAFARFQKAFAEGLAQTGTAAPAVFASKRPQRADIAFAVYRNNVWSGWIDAVRDVYPVTAKVIGEQAFAVAVRNFAAAHPPKHALRSQTGDAFAGFLRSWPPAQNLPYIADLAALEKARADAFAAADAQPLKPADLASTKSDEKNYFPRLRLRLHPSLCWLEAGWPVDALWQAHQQKEFAPMTITQESAAILIARPRFEVMMARAQRGAGAFFTACAAGRPLAAALAAALDENAGFDFAAHMKLCFVLGAFAKLGQNTPSRNEQEENR